MAKCVFHAHKGIWVLYKLEWEADSMPFKEVICHGCFIRLQRYKSPAMAGRIFSEKFQQILTQGLCYSLG